MDISTTVEHVVRPPRMRRVVLALVGYAAYIPVALLVGMYFRWFTLGYLLTAAAVLAIVVALTWKYTSLEYEYSITGGIMTLSRIYGGRLRRRLADITVKDASLIAPFEGDYIAQAERYAPERTVDLTADLQHPSVYIMLYETAEKRRGILYFEATDKALRLLSHHNRATVVKRLGDE